MENYEKDTATFDLEGGVQTYLEEILEGIRCGSEIGDTVELCLDLKHKTLIHTLVLRLHMPSVVLTTILTCG